MKIGIIGATDFDTDYLICNLRSVSTGKVKESYVANMHVVEFKYLDSSVVVCTARCGKVNGAVAATILITKYECTDIINIGSCGSLSTALRPGAFAIPKTVAQYDCDTTGLDEPRYVIQGSCRMTELSTSKSLRYELMRACPERCLPATGFNCKAATGDTFIHKRKQIKFFGVDKLHPTIVDMESGAIGQVCWTFRIPFAVLKQVADICDADIYGENKYKVSSSLSTAVIRFLEAMYVSNSKQKEG